MASTPSDHDIPWLAYLLLISPRRVAANLELVRRSGLVREVPGHWQVALGALRMWHRMIFRAETVGTSPHGTVRSTWRARVLHQRAFRFPFLIKERAIAPWDMSGLLSSRERIIRHLLGAYHDRAEFQYDLEILSCYPGALEDLHVRAKQQVHDNSPRAAWLRDLTVFEGYHDRLLALVEDALTHGVQIPEASADNPDSSFSGYLRWCAAQPATPAETLRLWRAGNFRVETGVTRQSSQPGTSS